MQTSCILLYEMNMRFVSTSLIDKVELAVALFVVEEGDEDEGLARSKDLNTPVVLRYVGIGNTAEEEQDKD